MVVIVFLLDFIFIFVSKIYNTKMALTIDVFYYTRKELVENSSIYYPSKKDNNEISDISYLQQVKSNLYSQEGKKLGVFLALNNFRSNNLHGINTGIVTIKTDEGIISWMNTYNLGDVTTPYLPNAVLFTRALFVSGIYAKNRLDVY